MTFEATTVLVAGDTATTTARFSVPGSYTLFATAGDGKLSIQKAVTVTVK